MEPLHVTLLPTWPTDLIHQEFRDSNLPPQEKVFKFTQFKTPQVSPVQNLPEIDHHQPKTICHLSKGECEPIQLHYQDECVLDDSLQSCHQKINREPNISCKLVLGSLCPPKKRTSKRCATRSTPSQLRRSLQSK